MRPRAWAAAAVAVVAVAVLITLSTGVASAPAAAPRARFSTVTVLERDLSATDAESGTLTYRGAANGAPYVVVNQSTGTYTALPSAGRVVHQGQVLYRVDNRPVVLLAGATPAFRALSPGASGPDVAELNADLVALGYARRAQLDPRSPVFSAATAAAVGQLQVALGEPRTGVLALGQAVFEPTVLRVTMLAAQLGGRAAPGQTALRATSSRRAVDVALSVTQESEVAPGDRVSITLPDQQITTGTVSSVGTVATCTGCGASNASPTVAVTVTASHPAALGRWDQAPVQVGITTARVRHVLVVPVAALLARTGGGYGVEVVGRRDQTRQIGVTLGLFDDADGLVQVTGVQLRAGQRVVVPST